jgi:DNA repair protein RecO (recombination protein O)
MEWDGPGIVLEAHVHGEGDLVTTLLTESGLWKGLAKGGASRKQAALWQRGNILAVRWMARTPEQLGAFTGELVRPVAALAMTGPESLAVLSAACALVAGAAPEREPLPATFAGLLRLFAGIDIPGFLLPELCRWEVVFLRELGFALDFTTSAGGNDRLAYVSPRTGRAVTLSEAGEWADRLLPLPAFLLGDSPATPQDIVAALRLTGHFFTRDVFGQRHRPLPTARAELYERLSAKDEEQKHAG